MPDDLSINIDLADFNRTIKKYIEVSGKTFSEVVVNKSFALAGGFGNSNPGALQLTTHADAGKIARELSLKVVERVSKSGKRSIRRKISYGVGDKDILAARIVNWRLKQEGKAPLWGKMLTEASRKLTAARIRSVNFARSGWIGSIKQLAPLVGRSGSTSGVKLFGEPKGYAIIQTSGTSPSVTIVNTSMNPKQRPGQHGSASGLQRIVEAGLSRSAAAVSADLDVYIERKLQQALDRL